MPRTESSETDHGLKSLDPKPHLVLARWVRRSPGWLVPTNLVVFALSGYLSVVTLGGYALEHPSHDTTLTDALQYAGAACALRALALCLLSLAWSKRMVLRVNLTVLLIVWPAEWALTWVLWLLLYEPAYHP